MAFQRNSGRGPVFISNPVINMRVITAEQLSEGLTWTRLIPALREQFYSGCEMPVRHHHTIERLKQADATLLLMPAWNREGDGRNYVGVKVVNVFPGNADLNRPAVSGSYLLSCGDTGELLAVLDGDELTAKRTAAASALAASYLANKSASHLLMVGTGRLSAYLVSAHASVRPIKKVSVWGRNSDKAQKKVEKLCVAGFEADVVEDLEQAVFQADIISCATLSKAPLICGDWLSPGTHLDLVGGFTPEMREVDDQTIKRARIFVDTHAGAIKEAGDITQPLMNGLINKSDIRADLYQLTRSDHPGREERDEITLFKSVGAALEDFAAAILAFEISAIP